MLGKMACSTISNESDCPDFRNGIGSHAIESQILVIILTAEIVCVGYTCPLCKRRVTVLRSCDPIPTASDLTESECQCGYIRAIVLAEIQTLDVWRESGVQTLSCYDPARFTDFAA